LSLYATPAVTNTLAEQGWAALPPEYRMPANRPTLALAGKFLPGMQPVGTIAEQTVERTVEEEPKVGR
jgi:hypothetical protein